MNIAQWLHRSAETLPDHPALLRGARPCATYARFAARAAGLGAVLCARGIGPGDRVAIWMDNDPDYLVALFGIWWIGAVAVPANAKLHAGEAAWIVAHAGARLVLADPGHERALAGAAPTMRVADAPDLAGPPLPFPRSQDDLAWIFYTSGTTGRPKGAMLSHGNLVAMSLAYLADVEDVDPRDCLLHAAPLSHGAGLYSLVHVLRGARHCFPDSGGFDGDEVLDLAARIGRVSLFAAPTMVRRMTEAAVAAGRGGPGGETQAYPGGGRRTTAAAAAAGRDGTGLKTVIYGGGPMYRADLLRAMRVLGPRFAQIYGQGESPMTGTVLPRSAHGTGDRPDRRIASVGRPHAVIDLRVTVDGHPAPAGTPGEIELRGPTVMRGYLDDPEATASALRDGWLRTGDIGVLDAEGYLTLTDRSKDVIISGGSNIYPREVEEILLTHPAVREASVIGIPDAEWGETVVAVIVADDLGGLEDELDRLCRDRIARFKRPKRYLRVGELPKNNYGKVLKTDLRRMLA